MHSKVIPFVAAFLALLASAHCREKPVPAVDTAKLGKPVPAVDTAKLVAADFLPVRVGDVWSYHIWLQRSKKAPVWFRTLFWSPAPGQNMVLNESDRFLGARGHAPEIPFTLRLKVLKVSDSLIAGQTVRSASIQVVEDTLGVYKGASSITWRFFERDGRSIAAEFLTFPPDAVSSGEVDRNAAKTLPELTSVRPMLFSGTEGDIFSFGEDVGEGLLLAGSGVADDGTPRVYFHRKPLRGKHRDPNQAESADLHESGLEEVYAFDKGRGLSGLWQKTNDETLLFWLPEGAKRDGAIVPR